MVLVYMLTFGVYSWDPCYHITSTMDPSWDIFSELLRRIWSELEITATEDHRRYKCRYKVSTTLKDLAKLHHFNMFIYVIYIYMFIYVYICLYMYCLYMFIYGFPKMGNLQNSNHVKTILHLQIDRSVAVTSVSGVDFACGSDWNGCSGYGSFHQTTHPVSKKTVAKGWLQDFPKGMVSESQLVSTLFLPLTCKTNDT